MRVISTTRRDDRGSVLIIVAAFSIVAVIFLAFVVDIGNQRQDRRQLTTATDAAALDVAKRWADNSLEPLAGFTLTASGSYECTSDAEEYLDRNRPIDEPYECEARVLDGQLASVRVYSAGTTDYQVGQAIGINQGGVNSTTSVRITSGLGGGLRPFAVCSRDPDVMLWYSAALAAVAADQPVPDQVITVSGTKALPLECEKNNGNWGFVRFVSQDSGVGTTGQNALAGTLVNGTLDPLSSFDNGDADYDEEKAVCIDDAAESPRVLYDDQTPKVTCVFNDTGAGSWNNANTTKAFNQLIADGTTFHLPLYGEVAQIGAGELTGFPVIAFAEVQLLSYYQGGANDNSVTLRFLNLSSGDCCDVNDSNQVLEICDVGTTSGDVLASFATACQTSTHSSTAPPYVPPPAPPSDCEPTETAQQTSAPIRTGSTLDGSLDFEVEVADPADCDGLGMRVVRTSNGATLDPSSCCSLAGATYSASFPGSQPGWQWNGTNYELVVFIGDEDLASYPFTVP